MSVPALRFKDDDGQDFPEWEEKSLGEAASFIKDGTHGTHVDTVDGKYFLLSAKNIRNGGIFYDESDRRISINEFESIYKNYKLCDGDVLLSVVGTIGRVAIYSSIFSNVAFQRSVAFFRFKNESSLFIAQLFTANNFQNCLLTNQVVSAQPGIYLGDLAKIRINLPSLPEQTKIANFLTAVDEKITQLTQKHDLLIQYKKGVMQQIFSQELRFKDDGQDFPEWEESLLGTVAEITTGSSNRVDSTVGDGAYTFFDRSQDIRTSDIYLFDCEAVIVAGEGQEFIPKHFVGKFDLHQRTYAITGFRGIDGKFLFYFVYQFRSYFLSQAVGSTVKSLRLLMFQKMPVEIPCLKEQTKIANFLTAIDDKITATQIQLQAVKQYKQGLLQQMFV